MENDLPPRIPGYRDLTPAGRGAAGTVYRAVREATGEVVALKVLRLQGEPGRRAATRLVREYRILANLRHPGIVRGMDFGEADGAFWIAMEFAEGKTVRELLEQGKTFTEAEALRMAAEVASAMRHYVERGIVHRDLKPGNLMIGPDGGVKVMDLGLAKDELDLALTHTGITVGTPQYLSPEQARDPRDVDIRSDIYALGSTLYHMTTGRPAFHGDTLAEVITKLLFIREVPADIAQPALSAPFGRLLRRMMEKDPGARYTGPDDLLRAIRRVERGKLPDAPLLTPAGRWVLAASGAALLGVLIWNALPRGGGARPDEGRTLADSREPAPDVPLPPTRAPEPPEYQERLDRARRDARKLLHEGKPGAAVRTFLYYWEDETRPPEVEEELERIRGEAAALLQPRLEEALARAEREQEDPAARWLTLEEAARAVDEEEPALTASKAEEYRSRAGRARGTIIASAQRLLAERRAQVEELRRQGKYRSARRLLDSWKSDPRLERVLPAWPVELEMMGGELEDDAARTGERLWNEYTESRRVFELTLAAREDLKAGHALIEAEKRLRGLRDENDDAARVLEALQDDARLLQLYASVWPPVIESLRRDRDEGRPINLSVRGDRNPKIVTAVSEGGFSFRFPKRLESGETKRLADLDVDEIAERAQKVGPVALAALQFLEAVAVGTRGDEQETRLQNALRLLRDQEGPEAQALRDRIRRHELEALARRNQAGQNAEKLLRDAEDELKSGRPQAARPTLELLRTKAEFRGFYAENRHAIDRAARQADAELRFDGWRAAFHGAVRRRPGTEEVVVEYDFSDPAQLQDFEVSQGWKSDAGALRAEGAGTGWSLRSSPALLVYRGVGLEVELEAPRDRPPAFVALSLFGNNAGLMNLTGLEGTQRVADRWFQQTAFWKRDVGRYEEAFHCDGRGLPPPHGIVRFALEPGRRHRLRLELEVHAGEYTLVLAVDGRRVHQASWVPEPGRHLEVFTRSPVTLRALRVNGRPRFE